MEKTINGHTKQEAIELAFRLGYESEKNRFSCSQSTFHAITTVLGYRNADIFKSLLALQGGGANSCQNSCGAFCGPLVAFGLFFGRDYELWEKGKMDLKASVLGEKLLEKFHQAYGSAICKDIQTHCLGFSGRMLQNGVEDKEVNERFQKAGGHGTVAVNVVGRACAWAIEILWDELPKDQDIDLEQIPSREIGEKALANKIKARNGT